MIKINNDQQYKLAQDVVDHFGKLKNLTEEQEIELDEYRKAIGDYEDLQYTAEWLNDREQK